MYPYHCYITIPDRENGNYLYHDARFLSLLRDTFKDFELVCNAIWNRTVGGKCCGYCRSCNAGRDAGEVQLPHARFKAKEQDEIERPCVRLFDNHPAQRPKKAILVCTQIIEQSLDVDFDGKITQIAPIDLLLQQRWATLLGTKNGSSPSCSGSRDTALGDTTFGAIPVSPPA